jgi:hypothetical protein
MQMIPRSVQIAPLVSLNFKLTHDNIAFMQPLVSRLQHGAILRKSFGGRANHEYVQQKLNNMVAFVG